MPGRSLFWVWLYIQGLTAMLLWSRILCRLEGVLCAFARMLGFALIRRPVHDPPREVFHYEIYVAGIRLRFAPIGPASDLY